MDVAGKILLRQRHELRQRQRHRIFHETKDLEPPSVGLRVGLDAEIENRPVFRFLLPRREAIHMAKIGTPGDQSAFRGPFFLGADELVLDLAKEIGLFVLTRGNFLTDACAVCQGRCKKFGPRQR